MFKKLAMFIGATNNKLKEVEFQARRWNDSYGNTYHVTDVYANGKFVGSSPITYGYGSSYEQTGMKILGDAGYYPRALKNYSGSTWTFFRDRKIKFSSRAKDVNRKRDL